MGQFSSCGQAKISIHAPLTGSDGLETWERFGSYIFQSTLPLRGATWDAKNRHGLPDISIHAPLTGSDNPLGVVQRPDSDFNPRSPYGERPEQFIIVIFALLFQSTLPLRGATFFVGGDFYAN